MSTHVERSGRLISPIKDQVLSHALLRAGLVVAWLATTTAAFYIKSTQLLIGLDGGYMLNLAERQFRWHVPLFHSSIDFFQGLGDIFFAVNFRLLPAFIAGSYFQNLTAAKVAIYEVVLCELTVAIILFGISLGASLRISVAAALVICLTFMPLAHPTLIYGILPLIPHMGSLIASALIVGAAFLQYGRRGWLTDLPFACVVMALLLWSVLVSITIVLLAAPFLLLCAVSGTLAAQTKRERACKIGLLAAATLLMLAGPAIYFVSTIFETAAVTFPSELANDRATFFFASILFHWKTVGPAGPLLMLSAIAGAAISAFDKTNRTLRIFAITLLTYLTTRLTFAVLIIVFDFWRGPAALYFEFFVIPLYAIFAVLFWARILERFWRLRKWMVPSDIGIDMRMLGTFAALCFALIAVTKRTDWGFPYPPKANAITQILSRDSSLHIGSPFRGRTADMIGRSLGGNVDWLKLHGIDGALASQAGNDFRILGMHYFGIPTYFEYTPTISPYFYAVTTRLLALPTDMQMRNVIVFRNVTPRILTMLGVRFVITDSSYAGPAQLRSTLPISDRTLFLYELTEPNLGNYSPTAVTRMTDATGIIARLSSADFDPKSEVIGNVSGDTTNIGLRPQRAAYISWRVLARGGG